MKKVLIIGEKSYIGNSIYNWLLRSNYKYFVRKISARDNMWKEENYGDYDTIVDVCGIAHVKPSNNKIYYDINRDLAIKLCEKAKSDGAKQFIYMSSMSVYGNITEMIKSSTIPVPITHYGISKLQAETEIVKVCSDSFKTAIIRPPVVYGKECKGNYPKLSMYSKILKLFPKYCNTRSIIYIDNLCELVRLMIDNNSSGTFWPQNDDHISTIGLMKAIANVNGKKIIFVPGFEPIIKYLSRKIYVFNRIFADDYYDINLSNHYNYKYNVVKFDESIRKTEM